MPPSSVYYELVNGFIKNWLVAGPQTIPVNNLDGFKGDDLKQQIARSFYEKKSGITRQPVECGPLAEAEFKIGNYLGCWTYYRCQEDHFVDHSGNYPACTYLRSWAYTQLVSETTQQVTLSLATLGSASIWINKHLAQRLEQFNKETGITATFEINLKEGVNEVLVRFENVALGACRHALALRINQTSGSDIGIKVCIPSLIKSIDRRNRLEKSFEEIYPTRDFFSGDEEIRVKWPEHPDEIVIPAYATIRLQKPAGTIYAEADVNSTPGDSLFLGYPSTLTEGPYQALLMPVSWEVYEQDFRFFKKINLQLLGNNRFTEQPYSTYEKRRQEALLNAIQRENTLFSEVARAALGRWASFDQPTVLKAIEEINQRLAGSELYLLGLLGMVIRYGSKPEFPKAIKKALKECVLKFRYEPDKPGHDTLDFTSETSRILFAACKLLAGQLYPQQIFTESGQTGAWHRQKGEQLALDWLNQRAAGGFGDWDSHQAFADGLVALSHLADLAHDETVWEMATVMMDKYFLSLALNSFKGVFGSSHGSARNDFIKSGLLEPTAGITRLMWGLGIFNRFTAGTVSLACMNKYELPPILAEMATEPVEELWNREHHLNPSPNGQNRPEINKVTYRSPDFMLSSAQDFYPGQLGATQHIWQATLGSQAVVFVNHPTNSNEEDHGLPGYWLGNAVLPRVAQWKDTLIAIYNLPAEDWMGFTHAWFPTYAFDETILQDGWAFARKGDGYLALTASHGLEMVSSGKHALRELRSYGRQSIWLCQMGRAALDGDFASFQAKVQALDVAFDGLNMSCQTLRGDSLAFGWQNPLRLNGVIQPLSGFKQYENQYVNSENHATMIEVRWKDYLLKLDFSS